MAGCKLTKSLENKKCEYAVAGASDLYLANWYPSVENKAEENGGGTSGSETKGGVLNSILYKKDKDGYIEKITLPKGESFFKVSSSENTLSFSDTLLAGGNGGKYRQHTVNAVLNKYDIDVLEEGNSLSLGKFIAIVVDKAGVARILGRIGGLTAPAGGFDYNSGAAEADTTGWTVIQQGNSTEIAPILKSLEVITPLYEEKIKP